MKQQDIVVKKQAHHYWQRGVAGAVALLLTACASWEQPGHSDAEAERDRGACEVSAWERFPVTHTWTMVAPGHWERYYAGPSQPPAYYYVSPRFGFVDDNERPRAVFQEQCMREKGWTLRYYLPWATRDNK